jgi:Na+-driven multidrug efflux pump
VGPLVALYGLEGESADLAIKLLLSHCALAALIWPIGFMLPTAFRAAGDVKFPMFVSMLSMWILRVAGAYFMALGSVSVFELFTLPGFGLGIIGVWIAMYADWIVRVGIYIWRYFSDRWLRKKFGNCR